MSIIKAENVFLDCPATSVDEALDFFAAKAVEAGLASDKDAVVAAFKERESQGTTGMTGGFAIPHAKTDAVPEPAVMVAKFAGDVAWESMDGSPVKMAIALFMPADNTPEHLKTLSKVAVMLMDETKRSALLAAADGEAVAQIVLDALA